MAMAATLRLLIKKTNGISKLNKFVVEKVQKSLLFAKKSDSLDIKDYQGEVLETSQKTGSSLPKDVKEGYFAVIGIDNGKPKRFVIPLCCLTHPTFLMLLEQAAEEFGFNHEGALSIPCQWSELERLSCKL